MLDSHVRLKPAIVHTLLNYDAPVEFTNSDWHTMEKVVNVLRPFVDATEMLSSRDASISMAIPCVLSIMKTLDVTDEDQGVKTMKRDLKKSMEKRFDDMESNDDYAVATLLDSKYRKHFFKDPDTLDRSINVVVDQLVDSLKETDVTTVSVRFDGGPGK